MSWSPQESARAARIWQRDVVDIYGEDDADYPRGLKVQVWHRIAEALGMRQSTVTLYYLQYGPSFVARSHRTSRSKWFVPPQVQAQRETRTAALDARDLTGQICGDPPVGYSALDRGTR